LPVTLPAILLAEPASLVVLWLCLFEYQIVLLLDQQQSRIVFFAEELVPRVAQVAVHIVDILQGE
jgi:hypothetical protein